VSAARLADGNLLDDPEVAGSTAWHTGRDGRCLAETALQLSGMHCGACADVIERTLLAQQGVVEARVNAAAQRAHVRWEPRRTSVAALIAAIRSAGYDAAPDAAAPARELRQAEQRSALWRLFVASFCMMQVMMLAAPSYVAGSGELTPDLARLLNWGSWLLTLPVIWWSAAPFFKGAWRSLRSRRMGMDVPVALGIAVTFVASSGATFDPGGLFGHEVYFDSLTMFVSFLLGGRYLEMRARHRASEALEAAVSTMPQVALRLCADGSFERVAVGRLVPGDRVQVAAGESFPADGRLLTGSTQADEAMLTGESHPVAKEPGDLMVGGSINLAAPIVMRVERVGADTRYQRIVELMRNALTQRPAMTRAADRWATPFLWVVLMLAAGAAAVWSVIEPSRAVWVAVSVLIVTCPCALSLASPSALIAAARGLARRGVLVQRLDALEALARVRQVFIDKTGTLTEHQPQLIATSWLSESVQTDAQLLRSAAALASWSMHPLSQALLVSEEVGGPVDASSWSNVTEQPGRGLSARDAHGNEWRLGSASWVGGGAGVHKDGPELWFGPTGRAVLRIAFDERLRDDACAAIDDLRAAGIRTVLLSGDSPARVAQMALRLHVTAARGGATPEDKLEEVRAAQATGATVAMVGDGINDAPVLAQADVSFAMGQGAVIARTHADVIVLSNRMAGVTATFGLAHRTEAVVHQNLVWAALYNLCSIPLALFGWLPPWAAGLGMALSSLLVIGNSLRLAR
jgi:P-type Cu2+ transporter